MGIIFQKFLQKNNWVMAKQPVFAITKKTKKERRCNKMFSFKGIKAQDMNLRILNDITFESPNRSTTIIQIPGRNGSLIMDNGRYEDITRSIPCRLEAPRNRDVEELISRIHNWLGKDIGYHEFLWHKDPDYVYRARAENGAVSGRKLSRLANTLIDFRIHPIKYIKSSMIEREVDHGTIIVNDVEMEANPVIRIVGTGLVWLRIGGSNITINIPNDAEGCIIDSENRTITSLDKQTPLFRNTSGTFPTLDLGNNPVTWESINEIQVFITPRLGVLV